MAVPKYSFSEDFSIHGTWWRPGGKYRQHGNLHKSDHKIQLDLIGAFDDLEEHPLIHNFPDVDLSVIHGLTVDQTPISLLNSFYTNQKSTLSLNLPIKVTSSNICCNAVIHGAFLNSVDSECFSSCRVSFPNFDRWLNDLPFSVEADLPEFIDLKYTHPEPRIFKIDENIGDIEFKSIVSYPPIEWDEFTITNKTFITIKPIKPRSFDWFIEVCCQIERMFTLFVGSVVQFSNYELSLADNHDEATAYFRRKSIEQSPLNPFEFTCRYPDVQDWFPVFMRTWLTLPSEVQHAHRLVFTTLESPAPFMESRFLPLVQAVEVFSRSTDTKTILEKSEFRKIRDLAIDALPKRTPMKFVESLKRSFQFANEPTLRDRFHYLIKGLDPETVKLFCVNPEEFAKGIVKTRNQLVHYSDSSKGVLEGNQLHWATFKLKTMISILMLCKYGIPEANVRELIKKNHDFSSGRRVWENVPEVS
ncbi:ApeA N-terminal domain 1-containing protein [Rubinisphaera italica]|uniref:Uncharacterized protein n=1 Tax=Rubinisphaera italica TaxID=2527969 RepID=A0A5C5XJP6_9PLAN|nr:HEPN domain-containing protein [Rubinisphaera italica]TWT62335.1 hypothetical protein Pan54_30760 [Rubinisphaera italica]